MSLIITTTTPHAPTTPIASADVVEARRPLHHALPAVVVHTALRREFRLAGPLVRQVRVGDTRRARVVAGHLDVLLRILHHHHELEDDQVWPLLRARASVTVHPLIDVMQAQHDEIDRLVQDIAGLLRIWATDASASPRTRLAEQLEALQDVLVEHLDLEERAVLPLAEQHLTIAEWREIGRSAMARTSKHDRALSLGMLQHHGDPVVVASMLASAPLPVRMLVPRLARRAYRRHAVAVHGTPSP